MAIAVTGNARGCLDHFVNALFVFPCMFTVSSDLPMSNATAIVCVGGMCWLKPVATVLLMLCSAVLVDCLVLNPCCVVMFGMFCVIYGRIPFSSVLAITMKSS